MELELEPITLPGVVDKTQLVRIDVEHSRLMLETQYICKERAHFPGSKY